MDIFHAVKQLASEIELLETQIAEKKATLKKLWGLLDHQEQLSLDSPSTRDLAASPAQQPAAPKEKAKK
jgi:hypothetical protein